MSAPPHRGGFRPHVVAGALLASLLLCATAHATPDNDYGLDPTTPVELSTEQMPAPQPASAPSLYELHGQLRYIEVRFGNSNYKTLDPVSRIELTKAAAQEADLEAAGLDWRDLYGVIHAETNWIARTGYGSGGAVNTGLAQFDAQTARAYGVSNPKDPIQALMGSAKLIKEAAQWAADRARKFRIPATMLPSVIREGVSVYYNLSWKARHEWIPLRTASLPAPTQRHIRSTREGAEIAQSMDLALQESGGGLRILDAGRQQARQWADNALEFLQAHDFELFPHTAARQGPRRRLGE